MNYHNAIVHALKLKGCAANTIKSYQTYLYPYLDFLKSSEISANSASYKDMLRFISHIQSERGLSNRTVNMIISYLRFFQVYVLHKDWDHSQIPFRTFKTYLPYVPSDDVIRGILAVSESNPKLHLAISMLYATGMRISELCHLKCSDIYLKDSKIYISPSKNHADRYVPLPESIKKLILSYWYSLPDNMRPREWLFTQPTNIHKPLNTQWIQYHIIHLRKSLGIDDRFTAHSLRHAYATNCFRNGMDLVTLKAYLGHSSFNSTCIYIQLSATASADYQSPYDRLMAGGDSRV